MGQGIYYIYACASEINGGIRFLFYYSHFSHSKVVLYSFTSLSCSEIINQMQMVIDFTASWCGPCRFIAPFLAELAKKLPNVIFVKVDVDELKVTYKNKMKISPSKSKTYFSINSFASDFLFLFFLLVVCGSRLGRRGNANLHVPERREDSGQSGGSKEGRAAADYSKARCFCFCFCLITYDIICIICLFILDYIYIYSKSTWPQTL